MKIQEQIEINGQWFPCERDMTPEEAEYLADCSSSKEQQIYELKQRLASTDYKAIKYAEGWITEEEYAAVKAERQAIRDEINSFESEE